MYYKQKHAADVSAKKSCILLILGEQLHNIFVVPYHLQLVSIIPFDCCNCGRGGTKKNKNHNLIMLCVSLFQDCGLLRKTELAVIMKQVSGRKPMTRYFRLTSKEWITGDRIITGLFTVFGTMTPEPRNITRGLNLMLLNMKSRVLF